MLSPGYLMCLIRIPIHNSLQKTFSTLNTKLVFLAVTLPHTERPPTVPVSVFFFPPRSVRCIFLYMEEFQTSCERASSDVLGP